MDKEEVGNLFENYNLSSAAVVDKSNKLVGMITYDDVLTVLKEEAEDVLELAGVGDEVITDGVFIKTKDLIGFIKFIYSFSQHFVIRSNN